MSEISIGQSICRSIRLIESVGNEIESLRSFLATEFGYAIEKLSSIIKVTEDWDGSGKTDDNEWVYTDCCDFIGLGPKRAKKSVRYLSFQISLAGAGVAREPAEEDVPLIHINWWNVPVDFGDDYLISFSEPVEDGAKIIDDCFIEYQSGDGNCMEHQWSYSLVLTSINSIDDVRSKIIEPFRKIIMGVDISEIGLSELDGIVKYKVDDEDYLTIIRD